MGLYNNDGTPLADSLEKLHCPFGHGEFRGINYPQYQKDESYDYKCPGCSEVSIISIAGRIVTKIDILIKEYPGRIDYIKDKIKRSQSIKVHIGLEDFISSTDVPVL